MPEGSNSARKKLSEQRKSLALFDIILQNVDYGILATDEKGKPIYQNELALAIQEKYLKKKRRFLDRQGNPVPYEILPFKQTRLDEKIHSMIFEVEVKRNEPEKWFQVRSVPIFDKRKRLVYVVATWRDVTGNVLEERRRDHFIAIGSHELRTPLAGIKALNQVMQKLYTEKKFDQANSFFHKIDNKVNSLTKIIQDFIEVEKIRGDKLIFTPELFDLDELIASAVQEMRAIYKSHNIEIAGRTGTKIIADRERIYEVLTNLIGNAHKYSPESDKIMVLVNTDDKKITIGIQDFGIGLSKENQSNIFEPFYRVIDPATEKVHGLGLGLYISYKIVELHGGKMWVKSKKGKGSSFYFSIPRVIRKTKKNYEF